MTAKLGSAATAKALERLSGPTGVTAGLAALSQGGGDPAGTPASVSIRAQNVAADLAERTGPVQYPAVNIYCQRLVNDLKEKFRHFSGKAVLAAEIRHSQDRLDGLETTLQLCADAVAQALDGSRGDWGDGMYYAGGYEVAFGAVKHGGRNFLQSATVTFAVEVSK
jgi:hypothetical protein